MVLQNSGVKSKFNVSNSIAATAFPISFFINLEAVA